MEPITNSEIVSRFKETLIEYQQGPFANYLPLTSMTEQMLTRLGSEDVKQLVIITPAIMGPAYFREAAEVISAGKDGLPDRAKMMDVFRRHGMTLATPPHAKFKCR